MNKHLSTPRVRKFRHRQRLLNKLNEIILNLSVEQLYTLENVLDQMQDSKE